MRTPTSSVPDATAPLDHCSPVRSSSAFPHLQSIFPGDLGDVRARQELLKRLLMAMASCEAVPGELEWGFGGSRSKTAALQSTVFAGCGESHVHLLLTVITSNRM